MNPRPQYVFNPEDLRLFCRSDSSLVFDRLTLEPALPRSTGNPYIFTGMFDSGLTMPCGFCCRAQTWTPHLQQFKLLRVLERNARR